MKIEQRPKEGRKEVLILFMEDEPWKEIHVAIFGRRFKFPSVSNLDEWQQQFDQLEYRQTKNYVLRRLSMQSYHSAQLTKLLKERLVQAHTIQRLIAECLDWGYLDDKAWLAAFKRGKRLGLRAIAMKLRTKGLSREEIEDFITENRDPEEEKEGILRLMQTRYRHKDLNQPKERQKVIAALMRKGYDFEWIKQVFAYLKTLNS